MKDICLCESCIGAIRSRGEKLAVIELAETEFEFDFDSQQWIEIFPPCEWCEDEESITYNCIFI